MATSAILYEGPSLLDGEPIVVIATGIGSRSTNRKTGAMVQTYILRADVHPVESVRTGMDASICGDCPLRPSLARQTPGAPMCYVEKRTGPAAVYRSYLRGIYPRMTPEELLQAAGGRPIRYGTYGDPAAAPAEIWQALAGKGRTGYTHQWRKPESRCLRPLVMASVGTAKEAFQAQRQGWRTFRVRRPDEPLLPGEIACPASAEAGHKTQCERCGLCNGKTRGDRRANIAIIDHGPTASRKRLPVLN